ncbi:hypothetical protein [Halobacillus litoralis]|uniref:Uncharacterized protein n=1 Tax=Halobacillus litoralis TaxID=45668 RepID=A0A410MDY4_9BACI|nr:hypothetical protein [Halobacillus litoralis]QAS52949.1 hypothetical protein HLI_12470 [Halobacillus litoralis]
MNANLRSSLMLLVGIIVGLTIAEVISNDGFDWDQWVFVITGGVVGYSIIKLLLFLNRKKENS